MEIAGPLQAKPVPKASSGGCWEGSSLESESCPAWWGQKLPKTYPRAQETQITGSRDAVTSCRSRDAFDTVCGQDGARATLPLPPIHQERLTSLPPG